MKVNADENNGGKILFSILVHALFLISFILLYLFPAAIKFLQGSIRDGFVYIAGIHYCRDMVSWGLYRYPEMEKVNHVRYKFMPNYGIDFYYLSFSIYFCLDAKVAKDQGPKEIKNEKLRI